MQWPFRGAAWQSVLWSSSIQVKTTLIPDSDPCPSTVAFTKCFQPLPSAALTTSLWARKGRGCFIKGSEQRETLCPQWDWSPHLPISHCGSRTTGCPCSDILLGEHSFLGPRGFIVDTESGKYLGSDPFPRSLLRALFPE